MSVRARSIDPSCLVAPIACRPVVKGRSLAACKLTGAEMSAPEGAERLRSSVRRRRSATALGGMWLRYANADRSTPGVDSTHRRTCSTHKAQ